MNFARSICRLDRGKLRWAGPVALQRGELARREYRRRQQQRVLAFFGHGESPLCELRGRGGKEHNIKKPT